jgi:hypothetical protein
VTKFSDFEEILSSRHHSFYLEGGRSDMGISAKRFLKKFTEIWELQ